MKLNEFIEYLNKDIFHFSPLEMIGDKIFSSKDEMIEVYELDDRAYFLLDNIKVLQISLNELESSSTKFVARMYIRYIHNKMHLIDVSDRYYSLLRKITENTLFYDNIIYILNKDLDANLIYDQEGFSCSHDNKFMVYTEDDYIHISYKSFDLYKFNSIDDLKDLSKSVKNGLLEYIKNRKKRIYETLDELNELEKNFKNMLQ